MNKEELADMLNGREIGDEITPDIQFELQNSDLVVVFGASDDLMEFRGSIDAEVGASVFGSTIYLDSNGLFGNECDNDCPYYRRLRESLTTINTLWCPDDEYSWGYETIIPHATFDIMEGGNKYCKGIVFNLSDVK